MFLFNWNTSINRFTKHQPIINRISTCGCITLDYELKKKSLAWLSKQRWSQHVNQPILTKLWWVGGVLNPAKFYKVDDAFYIHPQWYSQQVPPIKVESICLRKFLDFRRRANRFNIETTLPKTIQCYTLVQQQVFFFGLGL